MSLIGPKDKRDPIGATQSLEAILDLLEALGRKDGIKVLENVVANYFLIHYTAPLEMLPLFAKDVEVAVRTQMIKEARGDTEHE